MQDSILRKQLQYWKTFHTKKHGKEQANLRKFHLHLCFLWFLFLNDWQFFKWIDRKKLNGRHAALNINTCTCFSGAYPGATFEKIKETSETALYVARKFLFYNLFLKCVHNLDCYQPGREIYMRAISTCLYNKNVYCICMETLCLICHLFF